MFLQVISTSILYETINHPTFLIRAIASQIPVDCDGTPMDHLNLRYIYSFLRQQIQKSMNYRIEVSEFALETQCEAINELRLSYEQV